MTKTDPQPQQQTNSNPPPGTPVQADVLAEPKAGGGVKFSLEWRFKGQTNGRKDPIDIPPMNHGDPGTTIHFHLHDTTGRGFQFNTVDPIWVSRIRCPKEASEDPEIPKDQIEARFKLLKVFNTNRDKCELRYALLFKDRDDKPEAYDPSIKNGGTV